MPANDQQEDKRFWIGQNLFVAMAGAGFFVVFDHPFWGTVFMMGGILGLIYSIRERFKAPKASSTVWVAALVLTWAVVAYDYYDRHRNATPAPGTLMTYWGSSTTGPQPIDHITLMVSTNGLYFARYKREFRLGAVAFRCYGTSDILDAAGLQKSGLFDITDQPISLLIKVDSQFTDTIKRGETETTYYLLLVPRDVTLDQFTTLRQAQLLGVKLLEEHGGPP